MELIFLGVLILCMVIALSSGFPVAFALPGSAIVSISLAAAAGHFFAGDAAAFFSHGGPREWLTAGVTNFRSLYWEVERDTLIAIPLFVFMGIMLERSRIAEDLLVSMARLFGPIPGGLGISVVFVGALLAATTGILGATVIAMGLISLPAMLRNNYSKPLATGTICASGTLGQIIPPSIVLIILADQLSNAADQAGTLRAAEYKDATGDFSMPSEFGIVSASAGDMFMGALIPGLILVGLYMLYILISAIVRPKTAPPVPYEGKYDRKFAIEVALSLVPPLALIFAVLGSIILGIATVNQAGAIGAVGATIMGGYRLTQGFRNQYTPMILAVAALIAIVALLQFFELNVKNISSAYELIGIILAAAAVAVLLISVFWSVWRAHKINDTLAGVMIDTAKTTSMVFIILLGAAMLTSAFRAFGGEELVKNFLTGLPGGFWTQFLVVMLVIFLLGFFLDFIEIAVVVVPIVAPILLADPSANITAVWFGVMVGLNIQTSFLTPPFGFALFYLRGVAPKSVKTTQIYKGAVAFIALQLAGLGIAGYFPSLVNYLPNRTSLTADTAPPPNNPKLQQCIEEDMFPYYAENRPMLMGAIGTLRNVDLVALPDDWREDVSRSLDAAEAVFANVEEAEASGAALAAFSEQYRPLHHQVRRIQKRLKNSEAELTDAQREFGRLSRLESPQSAQIEILGDMIASLETEIAQLRESLPAGWETEYGQYRELAKVNKAALGKYRRSADASYAPIAELHTLLMGTEALEAAAPVFAGVDDIINTESAPMALELIKEREDALSDIAGVSHIKSGLSKARRALRGDNPDREKALAAYVLAQQAYEDELRWRRQAQAELLDPLNAYEQTIRDSLGLRLQENLPVDKAEAVAACLSQHRDISLNF